MIKSPLATLLLAMALTVPAFAKTNLVNPAHLDVAGVKLGMTPEEARSALSSNGFSVGSDSMAESWNARVASEAGKFINTPKDNTRAVYATQAEGPESQKVEVIYEITALGSRASKIEYSRPGAQGSIINQVREKYGEPTNLSMSTMHYCVEKNGCPNSIFSKANGPSIEIYSSYSGRSSVTLTQGTFADFRWKQDFDAAVKRVAPNYGKAIF